MKVSIMKTNKQLWKSNGYDTSTSGLYAYWTVTDNKIVQRW